MRGLIGSCSHKEDSPCVAPSCLAITGRIPLRASETVKLRPLRRDVFDQQAFAAGLKQLGVQVTTADPPLESTIHVSLEGLSMDSIRAV